MFLRTLMIVALFASANVSAQSQTISDDDVKKLIGTKIRSVEALARHPTLVEAVQRQNAEHISMAEVRKRDAEWKASDHRQGFKQHQLNNNAGELLQKYVARNDAFNEAFLTDNQGANVAVYPPTSDYWQGDEEKWAASFNGGTGRTFVGPAEFDDRSNTYAVQVSAPVLDADRTVGVLVVGVTLDYFEAKRRGQ